MNAYCLMLSVMYVLGISPHAERNVCVGIKDLGPSKTSHGTQGWGTILYIGIEPSRPVLVSIGMSPIPSVGMGRDLIPWKNQDRSVLWNLKL